jgi:hypothetical protein
MFGGLIFASLDRHGQPSLAWRARRAAKRAAELAEDKLPIG